MDFSALNWLAILIASLVGFVIGWLWYGPLFGKQWMTSIGKTEDELGQGNRAKVFGFTFVFQFIMATFLAMFFYADSTSVSSMTGGTGAYYGLLAGFGWVATASGIDALFEQRSWNYILINAGYWILVFVLMGWILGAWN